MIRQLPAEHQEDDDKRLKIGGDNSRIAWIVTNRHDREDRSKTLELHDPKHNGRRQNDHKRARDKRCPQSTRLSIAAQMQIERGHNGNGSNHWISVCCPCGREQRKCRLSGPISIPEPWKENRKRHSSKYGSEPPQAP